MARLREHERINEDDAADTEPKTRMLETIAHYHTYVIGNFLSLLTAIAAYQAASLWFPAWITKLVQ
jgi:hypothetical protein